MNNALCNCLCGFSGVVVFFSILLMFVGVNPAFWGVVIGAVIGGLGLVNYD